MGAIAAGRILHSNPKADVKTLRETQALVLLSCPLSKIFFTQPAPQGRPINFNKEYMLKNV